VKKNLIVFTLFLLLFSCIEKHHPYRKLAGQALGTSFHITYQDNKNRSFEKEIDSLIHEVNRSLSTYLPESDISKINSGNTTVVVDAMFEEVFAKSKRIFKETDGIFDPTIGILVNAWGFGPGRKINNISKKTIDSLLQYVGFDKVKIINGHVLKERKEIYLDFNADAKGYAVDILGRFFEMQGIQNYLIEMGGEIRTRGKNAKGKYWKIAIEKPNFDGTRSYQTFLELKDESIATSGNYRKFKIDQKTGMKYAHTIDPKTGYPAKSDLLSASVIAKLDCADVDGYATALMAMGLEKSKILLENHRELKSFLIYVDAKGDVQTFKTDNLTLTK
jgi:thiamine biosynthesis lipoprotein